RPGRRSALVERELEAARATLRQALFMAEIRVCSTTQAACRAVAGALQALSAENRLVRRGTPLSRRWHAARVAEARPGPVPGWRRGVLSSGELAALWQLPSRRAKALGLTRSPL